MILFNKINTLLILQFLIISGIFYMIQKFQTNYMGYNNIQTLLMATAKPTLVHEVDGNGFYLAQFKTGQLAIFSYYLESNKQAVLIDPTFDLQPFLELQKKRGAKLINIILTHYHADYLSGHTQLGLPIIMGQNSPRSNSTMRVYEYKDNFKFSMGSISIRVLHTPGHTVESSIYVLFDKDGKQFAAFTGDTIFLGEVGRPDLALNSKLTKQDLAKLLFRSLQKCKKQIKDTTRIYPAHGAGSSCGKSIGDGNFCTMGTQKEKNYALKIEKQKQFVTTIIHEMPNPPEYFFHDATLNQLGLSKFHEVQKKANKPLTAQQFKFEMEHGAILLDVRSENIREFIQGAWLMVQNKPIVTWIGQMISHESKLVLFCDKGKHQQLIARLLRIGYFHILGYNNFTMEDWKNKGYKWSQLKIVSSKIAAQTKKSTILDVRKPGQLKSSGKVQDAVNIAVQQLPKRWAEIKNANNIIVHCRTGARARLGASILKAHGIDSSIIEQDFDNLAKNGLKVVKN